MAEKEIDEEIKSLRKWIYSLMVLVVAGGGVAGSGEFRAGKFTAQDYKVNSELMLQQIRLEMQLMEAAIRDDMPPTPTRKRIKDIEYCLERQCVDFRSKVHDW